MNQRNEQMLAEMGIKPQWRLRAREAREEQPQPVEPAPVVAVVAPLEEPARSAPVLQISNPVAAEELPAAQQDAVASMDWDTLETSIRECRRCALCERRKQAVPGVGDRQADWLFVGEGPGADEDEQGEPFVGQAGKLLDAMLGSVGLKRGEKVYIANAVKCRPPNNRTPEANETASCLPYLARQIELIRPKLIVALGRPAAQTLLGQDIKIGAARGKLFEREGVPVVVTYHPAYLLRNPADKARAWEDLCFALDRMAELQR
ncbi:uracil-DNA glycosylase family protein [Uliginosibacterium sp. TH139]|uniref:uracil-DNA glycosylase n=1 Tax=Uliginosibacterium sp. TH139 TaxID=2067453 RepID=UPI000C7A0531|nr:uracil-DNA glycosylase [Uliginosibacterium sp. TH139]PLK47525.1 DNA polymerase III [Uliginosibacterium sp. TH139]